MRHPAAPGEIGAPGAFRGAQFEMQPIEREPRVDLAPVEPLVVSYDGHAWQGEGERAASGNHALEPDQLVADEPRQDQVGVRRLEEAVRQVGRHLRAAVARPSLVARAEVAFAPLPERRDRPEALRTWRVEGIVDRRLRRIDLRRAQRRAEPAPVGMEDAGADRVAGIVFALGIAWWAPRLAPAMAADVLRIGSAVPAPCAE